MPPGCARNCRARKLLIRKQRLDAILPSTRQRAAVRPSAVGCFAQIRRSHHSCDGHLGVRVTVGRGNSSSESSASTLSSRPRGNALLYGQVPSAAAVSGPLPFPCLLGMRAKKAARVQQPPYGSCDEPRKPTRFILLRGGNRRRAIFDNSSTAYAAAPVRRHSRPPENLAPLRRQPERSQSAFHVRFKCQLSVHTGRIRWIRT